MEAAKVALFSALGLVAAFFSYFWSSAIQRTVRTPNASAPSGRIVPSAIETVIGFVTNFFDTLGIGSYATTTAMYRPLKLVRDEFIPGTLNVGHTLPTFVQAYLFMTAVDADTKTLILMILASVIGSWLGAGIVANWPRRYIQIGMGLALYGAASLLLLQLLNITPPSGDAIGLTGAKLAIGLIGNFVLGALMTLGIGLYGPCLILVSLLGMNPKVAFPIMMGSCAFLMPVANIQFIRFNRYSLPAALGLALGGIPAVFVAVYIVKGLPLTYVRWLVFVVVIYTATMMLSAAARERAESRKSATDPNPAV